MTLTPSAHLQQQQQQQQQQQSRPPKLPKDLHLPPLRTETLPVQTYPFLHALHTQLQPHPRTIKDLKLHVPSQQIHQSTQEQLTIQQQECNNKQNTFKKPPIRTIIQTHHIQTTREIENDVQKLVQVETKLRKISQREVYNHMPIKGTENNDTERVKNTTQKIKADLLNVFMRTQDGIEVHQDSNLHAEKQSAHLLQLCNEINESTSENIQRQQLLLEAIRDLGRTRKRLEQIYKSEDAVIQSLHPPRYEPAKHEIEHMLQSVEQGQPALYQAEFDARSRQHLRELRSCLEAWQDAAIPPAIDPTEWLNQDRCNDSESLESAIQGYANASQLGEEAQIVADQVEALSRERSFIGHLLDKSEVVPSTT